MKTMRKFGFAVLTTLWLVLVMLSWFGPSQEISESERRKLAQLPEITVQNLLDGKFMADFEDFTLDQFPLRDSFRRLKALFHYNVLQQGDNNDIYVVDGYAAKLEYPLNETSLNGALDKFQKLYDMYFQDTDCDVVFSIAPDKGFYLAQLGGYPAMDYQKLFDAVADSLSWAEFVDISACLSGGDYYRTDTHWRQEQLLQVAERLCAALESGSFEAAELETVTLQRPFYGVYYGQAALPMEPDTIRYLTNELIDGCMVYNYETGKTSSVYDLEKLSSRDLYDVYLSGATALLKIINPAVSGQRELVVFRDSFGSSLIPLLLKDYASVTVVDTRYIAPELLEQYLSFEDQDVLFLYSTLILNSSGALK